MQPSDGYARRHVIRARTAILPLACAACSASHAPVAGARPADACALLATQQVARVEITRARIVQPDEYTTTSVPVHPAFCQVDGIARPTSDSEIDFVVVIPVGDAWNGRYRQIGNGGFAGMVPENDLIAAVAHGDAAAGTNDGHRSIRGIDASWALGHPEKMVDFGWRAVHLTHDTALAIVRAYRGRAPRATYFAGCSDGGREGLMEAQRFPDDFDGIVVGAPANYATRLLTSFAAIERALLAKPGAYIPTAKLPALESAALAACADPADGGVIADPLACRFDPGVLRCTGADDDHCLTDPQIAALRTIYASPPDTPPPHVFFGLEPGAEGEDGSWAPWVTGTAPGLAGRAALLRFATTFFRYPVFADPTYDVSRGRLDRELAGAAPFAPIIDSTSPDLDAFAHRGSKLLVYHGWNDPVVPPRDSISYFDQVHARAHDADIASFYRLFMVPGMLHCEGGRGPSTLPLDQAIEAWVEHGQPPAELVGTTPRGVRWRLAPYPERPRRLDAAVTAPGSARD